MSALYSVPALVTSGRRALERDGLVRRVAPFAGPALLALVLALVSAEDARAELLAAAIAGTVVVVVAAVVLPWARWPAWAETAVPLAYLGVVALLDNSEPGGRTGYGPLVMLPIFWLSLYGSRAALMLCITGVGAVFYVPLLIEGATAAEVRRALLWIAVSSTVGFTVQALVRRERVLGQTSEARTSELEAVLAAATDYGIVRFDAAGVVSIFNHGAERIFGYSRDEVVGHPVALSVFGGDEMEHRAEALGVEPGVDAVVGSVRAGMSETSEWTVVRKDGSRVLVSMTISALPEVEGQPVSYIAIVRDVTAEREAERLKEEFTALVSHEFRTPLTSILGYTEMLLEESPDGAATESLEVIDRNARRLSRLVSDLLFAAQLESGRFELRRGTVDLSAVARDALTAAGPAAAAAGIDLHDEIEDGVTCAGDADRLAQVADNLVSNAVKYSRGKGSVAVRVWRDGDEVVLEVVDRGIGIAPDDLKQLFDRFFRAPDVTQSATGGIGLGLAITRAVVDAHGGTIDVSSKQDEGTTFTVRLPAGHETLASQ